MIALWWGLSVVIADLNEAIAQTAAQEISEATGRRVVALKTDVTRSRQCPATKGSGAKNLWENRHPGQQCGLG